MSTLKKGAPIGRTDKNGKDLFVGDYVQAENGRVYTINKYTNLFNPVTGKVNWTTAGELTLISKEEFDAQLNKSNSKVKVIAPEVHEDKAESDKLNDLKPMPEPEAKAEEIRIVPAKGACFVLTDFSDSAIVEELKSRGFKGNLTRSKSEKDGCIERKTTEIIKL